MKVEKLSITNIRKVTNQTLELNKTLTILIGKVEQGKTTFIDAIRLLFQSGCPSDIIQHGKDIAEVILKLDNGTISRKFARKDNICVARPLQAFINNEKVSYKELIKMISPYQLDQDFISKLAGVERKKYFIDLFGIDTTEIDKSISMSVNSSKELKSEINAFGEIDLTEVEEPKLKELLEKETKLKKEYNEKALKIRSENKVLKDDYKIKNDEHLQAINEFNETQKHTDYVKNEKSKALAKLTDIVDTFEVASYVLLDEFEKYVAQLKDGKEPKPLKSLVDETKYESETDFDTSELAEIQTKISDAKANQILFTQYQDRLKLQIDKNTKIEERSLIEIEIRELRKSKLKLLNQFSDIVEGLTFDENGNLFFEEASIENISTSQGVRLGSLLSKLYPENLLDLELIDRAESIIYKQGLTLNKETLTLVENAAKNGKKIIATVVSTELKVDNEPNIEILTVKDGVIN